MKWQESILGKPLLRKILLPSKKMYFLYCLPETPGVCSLINSQTSRIKVSAGHHYIHITVYLCLKTSTK